tara:strand:+ start:258 stop:452 length:195 start_codon:yes stop_codon:yes gene_type:complete
MVLRIPQVVILIVESAPVEPIVTLYSSVDVEGGYSLVVDAQIDEEIKSLRSKRRGKTILSSELS